MERRRVYPFGKGETIHVLAAEDDLDTEWVESWLERIVGRQDERFRRCAEALQVRD